MVGENNMVTEGHWLMLEEVMERERGGSRKRRTRMGTNPSNLDLNL